MASIDPYTITNCDLTHVSAHWLTMSKPSNWMQSQWQNSMKNIRKADPFSPLSPQQSIKFIEKLINFCNAFLKEHKGCWTLPVATWWILQYSPCEFFSSVLLVEACNKPNPAGVYDAIEPLLCSGAFWRSKMQPLQKVKIKGLLVLED